MAVKIKVEPGNPDWTAYLVEFPIVRAAGPASYEALGALYNLCQQISPEATAGAVAAELAALALSAEFKRPAGTNGHWLATYSQGAGEPVLCYGESQVQALGAVLLRLAALGVIAAEVPAVPTTPAMMLNIDHETDAEGILPWRLAPGCYLVTTCVTCGTLIFVHPERVIGLNAPDGHRRYLCWSCASYAVQVRSQMGLPVVYVPPEVKYYEPAVEIPAGMEDKPIVLVDDPLLLVAIVQTFTTPGVRIPLAG